jgi:hypothetical protein
MIATLARWHGAVLGAVRTLLHGARQSPVSSNPLSTTTKKTPPPATHVLTLKSTATPWPPPAEAIAPAQAVELPTAKCQPPGSTPGSFNFLRTHDLFRIETGLLCGACGLQFPEEHVQHDPA